MNIIKLISLLMTIPLIRGHFGYRKSDQHKWTQKFKSCGGKLQSPVSISSLKSIPLPLPALEMIGYHDYLPGTLHLKNNGHSVAMSLHNDARSKRLPYIFGATLPDNEEYQVDHLHFHWGAKNSRGSEHTLDGVRYPMEMHIVHRNKAYSNLSDALNHENGLVVLGIFFQEENNKLLHPILNDLKEVQWMNNETRLSIPITLASLLPRNTDVFYVYKGSLTTPPCNEVVTWMIFSTPVPISLKQLNWFRSLHNKDEKMLVDNYRKLQDLRMRKVYVRRLNSYSVRNYNGTIFNVTNLTWFWQ
ncbi:carbonic anhydrase 2 isoform X2 [Halictus rubicundus]|uniref:carbonic anhydrase 2 isoform X2 n=1 Tax=Halictus rubicundus TaxID=77578 RepID=UPI004036DB96